MTICWGWSDFRSPAIEYSKNEPSTRSRGRLFRSLACGPDLAQIWHERRPTRGPMGPRPLADRTGPLRPPWPRFAQVRPRHPELEL